MEHLLSDAEGGGHIQIQKDVVKPGRGSGWGARSAEENTAIAEGSDDLGMSSERMKALSGEKTPDLYLNIKVHWSNVPGATWERLGGYQILKQWLSYQEWSVLGREITKDEAREFMHVVRLLAPLVRLGQRLDANSMSIHDHMYAWLQPS